MYNYYTTLPDGTVMFAETLTELFIKLRDYRESCYA